MEDDGKYTVVCLRDRAIWRILLERTTVTNGSENENPLSGIEESNKHIRRVTDPIGHWLLRYFSGARVYDIDSPERVEAAREDFLNAFARRSWQYFITASILLLLLIVIECTIYPSFPKQGYGLALDLIGAAILGRGLLISPEAVVERSSAGWGGPLIGLQVALAEDTAEGIWGISLLILGVLFQGLAVTGIWIQWVPCFGFAS